MEKLKLKVAELKTAEVLEREELKQVLSGVKSGSGSKGSGSGSGSKGSGSGSKPGSGSGSGSGKKPCDGKKEGDGCSFIGTDGRLTYGICESDFGHLWCHSHGL